MAFAYPIARVEREIALSPSAWADVLEPSSKSLWISLLRKGGVGWRTTLLDVCCGAGGALSLGRGLGATVTGIDSSEQRIGLARHRVIFGDFNVGYMGALPLPDRRFNMILGSNLHNLKSDYHAMVREMLRVSTPSGRVILHSWAEKERCQRSALYESFSDYSTPEFDVPLASIVAAEAGKVLTESEVESIEEYRDVPSAWMALRETAHMESIVDAIGEHAVKETVFPVLSRFVHPDGKVRLRNTFNVVIATPQ